eukprot:GHVS01044856.1.p1 GENE.GHVS01044856.1~~GHVS01044856.1.p1  ORF type:complete len:329 (+),score=23.21 GHVS01044856.1:402-1388(+)
MASKAAEDVTQSQNYGTTLCGYDVGMRGLRHLIVERDPRRNGKENKNQALISGGCDGNGRILRLRLDIKYFDIVQLLCRANSSRYISYHNIDYMNYNSNSSSRGITEKGKPVSSDNYREPNKYLRCCGREVPSIVQLLMSHKVPLSPTRCSELRKLIAQLAFADVGTRQMHDMTEANFRRLFDHKPFCNLVFVGKHLCGSATDLSLKCASDGVKFDRSLSVSVCIASCCHHSCDWESFVGKQFLRKQLRRFASKSQFQWLIRITSWATSGAGVTKEQRQRGIKAKRMLDTARVWWLREVVGMQEATLVNFTSQKVTPENSLIISRHNN